MESRWVDVFKNAKALKFTSVKGIGFDNSFSSNFSQKVAVYSDVRMLALSFWIDDADGEGTEMVFHI